MRILAATMLILGPMPAFAASGPTLPPLCPVEIPAPETEESSVPQHRLGTDPTIRYAFGTSVPERWGFSILFKVDATGRVTCFRKDRIVDGPGLHLRDVKLTPERRKAISLLASAGYRPFLRDGVPNATAIVESIAEEELPETHVDLPDVPLDQVVFRLNRSGCYSDTCASYSLEVRGDGRVRYEGLKFADVMGVQEYRVPVSQVRELVESLRQKNIWSLRSEYRSDWDNPDFKLELEFGGQRREIVDVHGSDVGMPAEVTQFEDEVDAVGLARLWVPISVEGVERLHAQGFAFSSQDGAALLDGVLGNGGAKDDAIVRMLDYGAPANTPEVLAAAASQCEREGVVESLLAHRALDVDPSLRPARVDSAFQAAMRCGKLGPLRAIWEAAGKESRPATLARMQRSHGEEISRHVLLMLEKDSGKHRPWQGLQIARWLGAEGWDLHVQNADHRNLMDIAIGADDPEFVRFLLENAFDPNAPGQYDNPPLANAYSETMVLLLLGAGAKVAGAEESPGEFLAQARRSGWTRVVAFLKQEKPH